MIKSIEFATERVRLFPSTYKKIRQLALERHTSMAFVIDELVSLRKQYVEQGE